MKKLLILCAVALIAMGCQKVGTKPQDMSGDATPTTEFRETNLATESLPSFTKDVLLFKSVPPQGSTTNLFLHDAAGDKPFLPKDYYYVPAANRDDAKPALLPDQLLVQKGGNLSFFDTKEQRLTPLKGITVPAYATVIALNSITGGNTMLVALIDKDQLSRTPHPSVIYRVNSATATAERITKPLADNLNATDNRSPIAADLYDGLHNRVLQFLFKENAGYTGVQSISLDTGAKTELMFPETSNISVSYSYITVYPRDNNKNTINVVHVTAEKLALYPRTVSEYGKGSNRAFMNYVYLGKGFLVGMEYKQDNSIQFTMLQEQVGETFKPIHAASLPYTFVKVDNDNNVYMVLSSPELLQTRVARYNIMSNSFTGVLNIPGVSSGEIEFLR